jgi:hypothetical protein
MSSHQFSNEITLARRAEELGEKALELGLIPSFTVSHYPDSWEFFVPSDSTLSLTPEEAYLQFKKLVDAAK